MTVDRRLDAALLETSTERPRSLGESPLPTSPKVRDALARAATEAEVHRYPQRRPSKLESALAQRHQVSPEQIVVCGGGSIELISRCIRAFTLPGEPVHALAPTFDQLPVLVAREHRVACLVATPPSDTGLLYVASPNNPDSRVIGDEELASLRRALPPNRVLVVDRAWAGWSSEDELWSLPPLERDGPIVALHSMSKLFGLAGLRVGYAIAAASIAELLRHYSPGYEVSALVEAAALAAIDDDEHRARARALVRASRERLTRELVSRGWTVRPSTTHVLVAAPPADLFASMDELDLPIEPCAAMEGAVQLTVPMPDDVDAFLARLDATGRTASRRS